MNVAIGAKRAQNKYIDGMRAWRTGMEAYHTTFRLVSFMKTQFGHTLSIPANDWLYDEVHAWLLTSAERTNKKKVKNTIAFTGRVYRGLDSFGDGEPAREIKFFSDDHRTQKIVLDGHKVEVDLLKPDYSNNYGMNAEIAKSMERIQFTCFSQTAIEAVHTLLAQLVQRKANGDRKARMNIVDKWGNWIDRTDIAPRTKSSVVLREGRAEALFADVAGFLAAEGDYVKRCLPYHRGYLFSGPPGSGKTSIVKAIATEFNLDLWYLPLGDISKDTNLLNLINQVDARSILLIEDVDVFDVAKDRSDDGEADVTLSGLLNALDGVATPHGLITIMTSNKPEVLDEALIRSGRIDRKEFIDYADDYQANGLFEFFFEEEPHHPLRVRAGVAPSDILEIFKRHMNDPRAAEGAFRRELEPLHAVA